MHDATLYENIVINLWEIPLFLTTQAYIPWINKNIGLITAKILISILCESNKNVYGIELLNVFTPKIV